MKINKIIAEALALCIVGSAIPQIGTFMPKTTITAIAAEESDPYEDYTVVSSGKSGLMTYEIRLAENGQKYASITDCDDSISGSLSIPSKISGASVKEIDNGAFNYCENLTSVTFPNTLERIGWGAFYAAHYLGEVRIPASVRKIESNAFHGCYITKITIDYGLENLGGLAENSFSEIDLPSSVSYVNDAFYNCGYLRKLVVRNPKCEFYMPYENSLNSSVVIYGYEGSTAQALANKLGNQFVSLGKVSKGDVNMDGSITPIDATLALNQYSVSSMNGKSILDGYQEAAADVNNDNVINPIDATWILRYYSYSSMNGKGTFEDFIAKN